MCTHWLRALPLPVRARLTNFQCFLLNVPAVTCKRGGWAMRTVCIFVAALALTAAVAPRVMADEIFLCEDGGLLYVNAKNRKAMRDHPCVKAWFDNAAKLPGASVEASASPVLAPRSAEPAPRRTLPPPVSRGGRPPVPPGMSQR